LLKSLRLAFGRTWRAETARPIASRDPSRSTSRSTVSTDPGWRRVEGAFLPGQGPGRTLRRARPQSLRGSRLQPDRADDDGRLLRALDRQQRPPGPRHLGRDHGGAWPSDLDGRPLERELDPDGLRRRRLSCLPGGGAEVLRARAPLGRRRERDGCLRPDKLSGRASEAAARRGRIQESNRPLLTIPWLAKD